MPTLPRGHTVRESHRPRVSVIVPVKDTPPELLRRAVHSALGQDCADDVEIVVWDDGSTDPRTLAELRALARLSAPGRPLRLSGTPDNRGISAARNAACRIATGTWFLWLDSDDTVPSGSLRALLRPSGSRPQLVFGRCRVIRPDGTWTVRDTRPILRDWRRLRHGADDPLLRTVFAVHGGLVHRDLFWAVRGFDESLRYAELTDWLLRVLSELPPDRLALVDQTTYHHMRRADSHSTDRTALERDRVAVLRAYGRRCEHPATPRDGRWCDETEARLYDLLTDPHVEPSALVTNSGPAT